MLNPRLFATSLNGVNFFNASNVALAAFNGDFEPNDFDNMLPMPASSRTERTAPPAIIPVPSEAGLNITAPAPDFPVIG